MIKAIETEYNGYKFRSRLEARWAVFFDALGVEYEYEPEGFELPSGKRYLPDFRLKCYGTRGYCGKESFDLYIEVKPQGRMTQEDADKIIEFANMPWDENGAWDETKEAESNPILIVGNIPAPGCSSDSTTLGAYEKMNGVRISPFNYELIDGDYFAAYPAANNGKFYLWGDDSSYIFDSGDEEKAYTMARQARFEHGETPVIRHE